MNVSISGLVLVEGKGQLWRGESLDLLTTEDERDNGPLKVDLPFVLSLLAETKNAQSVEHKGIMIGKTKLEGRAWVAVVARTGLSGLPAAREFI